MHFDISLGVNWIRETSQLRDPAKIRNEVFADFTGASRLADVFDLLLRIRWFLFLRAHERPTYVDDVVSRLPRELAECQQVINLDHCLLCCLGGFLLSSLFLQAYPNKRLTGKL